MAVERRITRLRGSQVSNAHYNLEGRTFLDRYEASATPPWADGSSSIEQEHDLPDAYISGADLNQGVSQQTVLMSLSDTPYLALAEDGGTSGTINLAYALYLAVHSTDADEAQYNKPWFRPNECFPGESGRLRLLQPIPILADRPNQLGPEIDRQQTGERKLHRPTLSDQLR